MLLFQLVTKAVHRAQALRIHAPLVQTAMWVTLQPAKVIATVLIMFFISCGVIYNVRQGKGILFTCIYQH